MYLHTLHCSCLGDFSIATTKATYKSVYVGLTVLEGWSLTIMAWQQAGKHGAGAVVRNLHVATTTTKQREKGGPELVTSAFKASKPTPNGRPPPKRLPFLILPKQFY